MDRKNPQALWREAQREAALDYVPVMLDHQFFTGSTAAALYGLPVNRARGGADRERASDIEIAVFAPRSPPRRPGVRGSQIRPALAELARVPRIGEQPELRSVEGLRAISPATIWVLLAPRLPLVDRVVLGDAVLHVPRIPGGYRPAARGPFATREELIRLVNAPWRRSRLELLEALPLLRTGSASPPESRTRLVLVCAGLPEPELDYDVRDRHGELLGCSELAYPESRIAVEYESLYHRLDDAQWNRDIEKYRRYREAGWEVIRVTRDLLRNRQRELVRQTEHLLRQRGWSP